MEPKYIEAELETEFANFPEIEAELPLDTPEAYIPPARNRRTHRDAITQASGFIARFRQFERSDLQCMYFVGAGLLVGSVKDEQSPRGWRGTFQNVDLLVGPALWKWAEAMYYSTTATNFFKRVRCDMVIRNLSFTPELYNEKPVLRSRGILEQISFGGFVND